MSNRLKFFFRQRPTAEELNGAFDALEQADHNFAADVGITGIISGAEPSPHDPVPALSIDLTGRAHAYDKQGRRIYMASPTTVDCSVDADGVPTAVLEEKHERWLSVFLAFDRHAHDTRLDGNSQEVQFRQDESFKVVVRQAAAGPAGSGARVPLHIIDVLLCDVRLVHHQAAINDRDIDTSRRQSFVLSRAAAIGVNPEAWRKLRRVETVQAALDAADVLLEECLAAAQNNQAISSIRNELQSMRAVLATVADLTHVPAIEDNESHDAPEYSMRAGSIVDCIKHLLKETNKRLALAGGTIVGKLALQKGILAALGEPVDDLPGECGYGFLGNPKTGVFCRDDVLELHHTGNAALRVTSNGVTFGRTEASRALADLMVFTRDVTAPSLRPNGTWTQTIPLDGVHAGDCVLFLSPKAHLTEENVVVRATGCRDGAVTVTHTNLTPQVFPESKITFDIGIARFQP